MTGTRGRRSHLPGAPERIRVPLNIQPPAGFPLPMMPPRLTDAGEMLRRGPARGWPSRAPLVAVYDESAEAWAETAEPVCVARRTAGPPRAVPGALCGDPAEHRVAGIDLCADHFGNLERWNVEDARAAGIRRKSLKLRQAALALKAASAHYEQIADEAEARWERLRAERSVVYYLRRTSDGMIKIGTSVNFRSRFNDHCGEHGELQVLLICAGSYAEEGAAHSKFRDYQIGRTEWFRPARPLLDWICRARENIRYRDIQPDNALPMRDLRKLAREAPSKKNLHWEGGMLKWPPAAVVTRSA